jgi:tetratricopeptide (TPR) repeat protein
MEAAAMSKTLNLTDRLLHHARRLQEVGRTHEALRRYQQLARLADLPGEVVKEVHVHLAEIYVGQGEARRARRHAAVAIALEPECSDHHYLMAIAVEEDAEGDPRRAAVHYRRCLALEPQHAAYYCDYAAHALRYGQRAAGLKALRRAAELAPDDPETLSSVASGLRKANRAEEAKALLRAARFRNPREPRWRTLLDQHHFELLVARQHEERRVPPPAEHVPVILKLPRKKARVHKVANKTVRIDGPADLRGPTILPFHVRRKQEA